MADIVQPFSEIFANKVFFVPDYQRSYSWEQKQWNDLLEDLELLPEGRNHFTGTMVLRANETSAEKVMDVQGRAYKVFDIIDGQQRLTTVIILLKAVHDHMQGIPDFQELARGLQEMYLHHKDLNGQPFTKLTLNQDSQAFFVDNVLELHPGVSGPTIRSHQRLQGAKQYFADYLDKNLELLGDGFPGWLRSLYFKIIHQLTLIVYPVDSEMDAGVIFETMNDRGKPLTELELVKNYLLYVSSKLELKADHDLNECVNATWKHIFESLMAAGLGGRQYEDQLLRVQWLMAYNYDARRWQNNRSIKNRFSLRDYQGRHEELLQDLITYLDLLRNAATAFCDIYAPSRQAAYNDIQDQEIRRQVILWSKKLARLGPRATFLPLLIAVRLKPEEGDKTYLKALELCEKFDFRVYRWLRYRSNSGESRLFRLANEFFHSPNPKRLLEDLARAILDYCSDARFQERLERENENWYRWGGITYMLFEYENHLASGRPVQMTWETLNARPKANSIEHILPQTPDHPYWQSRFTAEDRKEWVHDIGNLTLTYDNSSLGNRPFPEKKGSPGQIGRYAGSPLFVERQVASQDEWTAEKIQERRAQLKEWALQRWYIEPPPPLPKQEQFGMDHILAIAERNGIGDELEAIHAAASRLKLSAKVRKSIQYRPPFDWSRSVMTVQVHPGGFWIYFRLLNFARFKGVTREQVDDIFPYKNKGWSWIKAEDAFEIVECLEAMHSLIEDRR